MRRKWRILSALVILVLSFSMLAVFAQAEPATQAPNPAQTGDSPAGGKQEAINRAKYESYIQTHQDATRAIRWSAKQ